MDTSGDSRRCKILFNHNVNNLNGGVSEQVDIARYDNQVEEMVNFVPTVSQGLRRRNPISSVSALTTTSNMAIHSYSRGDGVEKYGMIFDNTGIRVFDTAGVEKTVVDFGILNDGVLHEWLFQAMVTNLSTEVDATYDSIRLSNDGGSTYSFFKVNGGVSNDYNAALEKFRDGWKILTSVGLKSILDLKESSSWSIMYHEYLDALNTTYASRDFSFIVDWENSIKFLTVGDTTWILNTSIVASTDGALTPTDAADYTGFYWIKKSFNDGTSGANHGYTYQITLNGIDYSYNHTDSISVASNLASQINAVAGFTSRSEGSIVYISNTSSFTMASGDSWGNQASIGWGNGVAKIADLPASMDGFTNAEVGTIAITGTDKDSFTNYYLKWEDDHWKETVVEGVEYKLDHLTMPAKLVRQSDGTFSLGWNVENLSVEGFATIWGERDKGDNDSNPLPSFIGDNISNMFFFKNRLGFTSGENVILSQTASYYDFFASTVIEILDTDPIDAAADSNNISVIRAINVTAGAITLWTDTAQFILSGGEVLSPATTRISQTSSYVASPEIEPINVDNEVVFFDKKGDYLNVLSYAPSSVNNDKSTAVSLSAHIPEYLPATIEQVEVSHSENLMLLFDPSTPTKIYCYKYHIDNNKRVMSAWFEWTFGVTIKKINILEDELFIIADALYSMPLEIMPVTDTFLDLGTDTYESRVLLSRFHVQTNQNTQYFREKFFAKSVVSRIKGSTDIDIVNLDRGSTITTLTKHVELERAIIVGGDSDNVKVQYRTSYDNGVAIEALNIEGEAKYRTRNKD